MIKKLTSRKFVATLVVATFMLSFAGIAVSQEAAKTVVSQEVQEVAVEKITGMISDIVPDIGQVTVVEKDSDKTVILTAGPDVDLRNFNVGDHVVVEYSQNIIISINK